MSRRATIRVPATSANIGPGFDCLGIGLALYDRFAVEEGDCLRIEGCPLEHSGEDNLFVVAARRGYEELGLSFPGLSIRFDADVPIARGLGSSSACIVGGLAAAWVLGGAARDGRLGEGDRERILELAAGLEGHPDNVAPALLGGFVASILEGSRVVTIRAAIGDRLTFHALVPPFPLETAKARAALPRSLPFGDAVFNTGRAALVAAAFLSGEYEKLGAACSDRLHEPYRAALIPGFEELRIAAREAGALAVFLSGAGPTVMAIGLRGAEGFEARIAPLLESRPEGSWRLLSLAADDEGASIGLEAG